MAPLPMRANVARRLSLGLAAALLATAALATPASARDLNDPIFIPIPVHVPVDYKIQVVCGDDVCFVVSSEPCAGLVVGDVGVVVDIQYGVFVQAGATGQGPTAYGGYDERCEEKDRMVDYSYLESII